MDQNGSHVVQRIIECYHPEVLAVFVHAFAKTETLDIVAQDKFGCRIVQRLLGRLSKFAYPDGGSEDKAGLAVTLAL